MRRHGFALALIALVVAIVFARPLVTREVFSFRDHTDYFQPLRYYTAIQITALVLPYWNPYSASGEPWLANPQTGVFYPPTWMFTLLPFPTAYMLYLALHLLILGWGAYLLFARQASREAALVGAVALMVCGPVLSLLDVQNNFATFAWVPWVLWCIPKRPILAGVCLALAFLGAEPFFAAFAALLYVVVVRRWRAISATALVAFGLSAIQLLPFLESLRGTDRAAGLPAEQIARESMRLRDWLGVAIPSYFNVGQHFIPIVYVGLPIVILCIIGGGQTILSVLRRGTDRIVCPPLGWVALLVSSIVLSAFGGAIMTHLPLTLFRYPARLVPFGALAIVALAVLGWDRVRPRRRWADLIVIAIVLADLLPRVQPLLHSEPFRPDRIPYPIAVGRAAKFIRINQRPAADREAWIAGYLNLYQRRFDASTAAPVINARYEQLLNQAIKGQNLDFLGIGFVLSESPIPPLRPFFRVRRVTAYLNSSAFPLATWSSRAGTPMITSTELVSVDSAQARVVVNAPADGVVTIAQQDAPGWRVFVDGREAKKLLAGGIFRAVEVKRGRHEVIWRFQPRSMFAGATMTIITLLSLQLSRFVKRVRARKSFFVIVKKRVVESRSPKKPEVE